MWEDDDDVCASCTGRRNGGTQLRGTDRRTPRPVCPRVRARVYLVDCNDAHGDAANVGEPRALRLSKVCPSATALHASRFYSGNRFGDAIDAPISDVIVCQREEIKSRLFHHPQKRGVSREGGP
jgi:hypothetical protein